jgi:hypothetical protein
MDTIEQLIKDSAELFARITLNGEPDWQGEAANIPDDAYPEEDEPGSRVTAADKLFQPAPSGAPGDPATGAVVSPHESKAGLESPQAKPAKAVAAADAERPLTVEQLSGAVMEGLTGVTREWLAPVRPFFDRLAALAMSKTVTDEDFMAALEKAQRELPELFGALNTGVLEEAFEEAIGSAMLAGSVSRYEED